MNNYISSHTMKTHLPKVLLSYIWRNIYLIIGICIGLSLSFLFTPVEITNELKLDSLPLLSNYKDMNKYESKVHINIKPQTTQKNLKKLVRPRYYSTELGIREKLYVGVLTGLEYLQSRDVVMNKTMVHLVNKIQYFISIPEGVRPNTSLPGIIGFTDTRSILKPFHIIKYLMDNYLEDYDYYFLVKDTSYINARRLLAFVNKMNSGKDLHVGFPSDVQDYCSLDSGILLSNSVIQNLKNNLDWCVKNTYSDQDEINLGRCIVHSTSLPCTRVVQGQTFSSTKLSSTFDLNKDFKKLIDSKTLDNSITVYPIYDRTMAYKMNAYFTAIESIRVQKKIQTLRESMIRNTNFLPENDRNITWPVDNRSGNKATGRFDVLHWTYFNRTHSFHENNNKNVEKLVGDFKFDIDRIIDFTSTKIENRYDGKLRLKNLLNGYQKLDASKGMFYIFDMIFVETTTGKEIGKRIQVSKLLGKVEILPVPYVTENTRVNMILIVDSNNIQDTLRFMEHYAVTCMEKKFKTFLMMVLIYEDGSSSKGKEDIFSGIKGSALTLTERYKKDESKITWLSIRLSVSSLNLTNVQALLQIAITDLCVKKFSPETLILFVETGTELELNYLNRVRMNTIVQWQAYSPIPFIEFNPDIIYVDAMRRDQFDINRNYGKYDDYNYNNIAFYAMDYIAMRKRLQPHIPMAHTDSNVFALVKILHDKNIKSLFDMFVSFSNLHLFRAVEPALKIRYKDITCDDEICIKQKYLSLGNRNQLARLIVDYHI